MASSSSSSPELPLSRSTNNNDQSLNIDHKLHEVLEDLSSRFILNLPDIELDSLERVCFQVEQAHWYYEDFVREQDPSLPTMTLKRFSNSLFHVCPLLSHWGNDHEQTFQSFLAYKTRVPVCGAIMLNEKWDKCLLVKGWKATSAWSFPKGKINEQEERPLCAIREVLEETGYDLAGQIDPENVVELSIRDQSLSLFIVPNVPEDFCFETRTRKEISKISWFKLTDLPTWKRNKTVPGKFYLITPFIGPLKNFLRTHKPRNLRRPNEKQQPTDVDDEGQQDLEAQDPVAIAHESSSQSSQENGDPHTPSPLYSEAIINKAEQGISHEMQKTLNMDNVDPHFAKLLSSLSLSVSKPSVDSVADLMIQGDPGIVQAVSNVSPTNATVLNTRSPSHASTARQSRPTRTPSAAPRTPPSASSTSLRTPSRLGRTHSPRVPVPPTAEQHLMSPSTNGSATETLPSPTTRRVAAPVDISPYLTRAATAAPPVPKQLKYISMLENVVKESERMTPRIERQVLVQNDRLPLPGGQPMFAPSHPSPGAPYGLPAEPSVIYSSPQRPTGNFPPPSLPSYPQPSSAPSDDAFVVRPRTTSAFHPVPSMPSRPSLTDDQLRLVMSATGPRPPPMPPVGPYHLSPRRAGPPPPGPPPFIVQAPPPAGRAPQPNLRLIPPNQLPLAPYGEAPPLSAPALSPTFNRIPRANPTNNAQLLSILNTPSLTRATSSTSQPVLTNLGL